MIFSVLSAVPLIFAILMGIAGVMYLRFPSCGKLRLKFLEDESFSEDEHRTVYRSTGAWLILGALLELPPVLYYNNVVKVFLAFFWLIVMSLIGFNIGRSHVMTARLVLEREKAEAERAERAEKEKTIADDTNKSETETDAAAPKDATPSSPKTKNAKKKK